MSVLERRDEYGATPLLLAAYGGQTGVVLLLISAGADKCAADSTGRTAAHLAASNGQLAALRYVLGPAGARANVRDRYGAPSHRPWRHFCTTLYNLCRDSLRK